MLNVMEHVSAFHLYSNYDCPHRPVENWQNDEDDEEGEGNKGGGLGEGVIGRAGLLANGRE